MNDPGELDQESVLIRSGRSPGDSSLAPSLWPTSTFVTPTVEEARRMATRRGAERFYTRYGNPTVAAFEQAVADLEGAEAARATSSGMGALSTILFGLCSSGDHVVAQRSSYGGTRLLLDQLHARFDIDVSFVDARLPGELAGAVVPGKTVLVLVETPSNPGLDLVDLDEVGSLAAPITVVDSTLATPLAQRPLDHGADLVVHSATKGLAGHNDATLGVIAGSGELIDWLWSFAVLHGASASPFDAMNGLRGLRTLAVRLERQAATAARLAAELEAQPSVEWVRYPGLATHPQHDLAKRQLKTFGGLLTFEVAGGVDAARRLVEGVRVAQFASSLGGPETLVTHPASTTHAGLGPDELKAAGIGPGTVRVSAGLEHPDDIVADILGALPRPGGS